MNFVLNINTRILVLGHNGMVGSAVCRVLAAKGYKQVITVPRKSLDLVNQAAVEAYFQQVRPEVVILAAAKVGGIQANIAAPAEFLYNNLQIQNNVIWSAFKYQVEKTVFLGSSCIYPKECPQPMKEEYLLTSKLEPTNEGYALAKISGLKLLEYLNTEHGFNGISIMPPNLYGPNDSFDLQHSHVLSALVKRFVDATEERTEEVTLWGSGNARREFMHVDDAAAAILFLTETYNQPEFINIGVGADLSIRELAGKIAGKTGFRGKISWDKFKPDGTMRKCMDVSRMHALGFLPAISLDEGIDQMISIYKNTKKGDQ